MGSIRVLSTDGTDCRLTQQSPQSPQTWFHPRMVPIFPAVSVRYLSRSFVGNILKSIYFDGTGGHLQWSSYTNYPVPTSHLPALHRLPQHVFVSPLEDISLNQLSTSFHSFKRRALNVLSDHDSASPYEVSVRTWVLALMEKKVYIQPHSTAPSRLFDRKEGARRLSVSTRSSDSSTADKQLSFCI